MTISEGLLAAIWMIIFVGGIACSGTLQLMGELYLPWMFLMIFRLIVHLGNSFLLYRLMFDPYTKIVYDYMGGIQDIRKAKV